MEFVNVNKYYLSELKENLENEYYDDFDRVSDCAYQSIGLLDGADVHEIWRLQAAMREAGFDYCFPQLRINPKRLYTVAVYVDDEGAFWQISPEIMWVRNVRPTRRHRVQYTEEAAE